MNKTQVEAVALQAFTFLAGRDELLGGFLGATGAMPSDLRARLAEPSFLASVLDYLLQEDAWVISCAEETGLKPTDLAAARVELPGGRMEHWT